MVESEDDDEYEEVPPAGEGEVRRSQTAATGDLGRDAHSHG